MLWQRLLRSHICINRYERHDLHYHTYIHTATYIARRYQSTVKRITRNYSLHANAIVTDVTAYLSATYNCHQFTRSAEKTDFKVQYWQQCLLSAI